MKIFDGSRVYSAQLRPNNHVVFHKKPYDCNRGRHYKKKTNKVHAKGADTPSPISEARHNFNSVRKMKIFNKRRALRAEQLNR
jgi:hypothetical protein